MSPTSCSACSRVKSLWFVFDDRVACRGLPRFRLVYDADRLGRALGRVRLLHGGHVDDLHVLPCGGIL